MNIEQLSKWGNLCRCHPTPWYLEKCNDTGVEIKDSKGYTMYYDDFGSFPDEMKSSERDRITTGSVALALWLVAYSQDPNG